MDDLKFEDRHATVSGILGKDSFGYARAKIPSGWIVVLGTGGNMTSCFIPDPTHIWDGASLPY